jgi:hypothetical protein
VVNVVTPLATDICPEAAVLVKATSVELVTGPLAITERVMAELFLLGPVVKVIAAPSTAVEFVYETMAEFKNTVPRAIADDPQPLVAAAPPMADRAEKDPCPLPAIGNEGIF